MTRAVLTLKAAILLALSLAPIAHGAATWRFEQPPPPPGVDRPVPLGAPGDLELLSPSRGFLTTAGNAAVPAGVFAWDGEAWRQFATVCGGQGSQARIAVAGPNDFWVIADPAAELRALDQGTTLCHFVDGAIAASYAVPTDSEDAYQPMNAAACAAPDDCWFGGIAAQTPSGSRQGAFHLHWDGTSLGAVWNRQGRGVSDIALHGGTLFESSLFGRAPFDTREPLLAEPEPQPVLVHRIEGGAFVDDPYEAPADSELLALDSDGEDMWAVGGGAASGTYAEGDPPVGPSGPVAAMLGADGFEAVDLSAGLFDAQTRFVGAAAVPGDDTAWVAVEPFDEGGDPSAPARLARIDPVDGVLETVELTGNDAERGSAARVACASATQCWMVTAQGWLFHLTDGVPPGRDDDPALHRLITARPADARTPQYVPDAPPVDDSLALAPPPVAVEPQAPTAEPPDAATLEPLLKNVRRRLLGRGRNVRTLELRFTLVRRARVGLVALRRKKVVARARARVMTPGRRRIRLRLERRRWPTRLRFVLRELEAGQGVTTGGGDTGAGAGDTVTTGGVVQSDTVATGGGR